MRNLPDLFCNSEQIALLLYYVKKTVKVYMEHCVCCLYILLVDGGITVCTEFSNSANYYFKVYLLNNLPVFICINSSSWELNAQLVVI